MPAEQTAILATLAGFTLGHVLFLAVHLWIKNTRSEASGYLTLLLLCMAVRVTKSVLMLIFPGFVFENILIALGVIAMAAIGPLIWLYIGKSLIANAPFKPRMLVHFVPGILLSYFAFVLNDAQMFLVYQVTVYLIATYILFTVITVARGRRVIPVATFTWIKEFLVACVVITVIFGIQLYTTSFRLYMGVSIAAAAVLYTISLRASVIKQPFHSPGYGRRKQFDPILFEKMRTLIINRKLYLDPNLTVSKLSTEVEIPVHILSSLINEGTKNTFSDFINEFRILEAEKKLVSDKWSMYTIEAIAYECGFNSLSAFYNSFKKIKNVSPARFRKQNFS